MPNVNVGVHEVKIYCFLTDQVAVNVRHLRVDDVTGAPPLLNLARYISTLISDDMKTCISGPAEYRGLTVRHVGPIDATDPVPTAVGRGLGAAGPDPLPRQVTGLISFYTDSGGRRNRGRMYVPFPAEGDSETSAKPSSAYVAAIGALADHFIGSHIYIFPEGGTANVTWVIRHGDGSVTPVTSRVARQKWATQRRRGSYGGVNDIPL